MWIEFEGVAGGRGRYGDFGEPLGPASVSFFEGVWGLVGRGTGSLGPGCSER